MPPRPIYCPPERYVFLIRRNLENLGRILVPYIMLKAVGLYITMLEIPRAELDLRIIILGTTKAVISLPITAILMPKAIINLVYRETINLNIVLRAREDRVTTRGKRIG